MQSLRQLGISILFAAISLMLILGGFSASLAESQIDHPQFAPTETSPPTREAVDTSTPTLATPGLLPSPTISSSPTPTITLLPPTSCPPPTGWVAYAVQVSDTLDNLALSYKVPKERLQVGNCLFGDNLIPNTLIYLPPTQPPTITATFIPCGAPASWITYVVKAGDNLYRISLAYRVTVSQLQNANCLGNSINIAVGQRLYVPNVPTSTPALTSTPTITATHPTETPTQTSSVETPTNTETSVHPSETFTPLPPKTDTPIPTFTYTPES